MGIDVTNIAIFGGGCFWCTETIFLELRGVISVEPGYAGGHVDHPTYEQVCTGTTGHAEVVRITFDPKIISYEQLVNVFLLTHDPTQENRQGPDIGPQYRSVIFFTTPEQRATALRVISTMSTDRVYEHPIMTDVEPLTNFYPAEDYHRNYFANHPDEAYCQAVINPKLSKFREIFAGLRK